MRVSTRRKIFVVLANRIVDIEPTNVLCYSSKILLASTRLFVEPTKEFVGFLVCWSSPKTKIFVETTKILLRQQNTFVGSISTILFANTNVFCCSSKILVVSTKIFVGRTLTNQKTNKLFC